MSVGHGIKEIGHGTCMLVAAGPGDPELLTLNAPACHANATRCARSPALAQRLNKTDCPVRA